jgi:hypothetical protein
MKQRILKMITTEAEAKREKALTSLELLLENPVGIGDHSTGDFYNNVDEAFRALIDADDVLETIKKYNWDKISEID